MQFEHPIRATLNLAPTNAHDEGWMVSDKETIFYWVFQQGKVLLVNQIMTESV